MFRVYLIVFALFAKPAVTQIPATCSVDLSKEERMTRIRANIINQIGLSEAPKNPKVPVLVSDSQMEEFRMLESALGVLDSNKSCTDRETFARTKTTFTADRVDIREETNPWKYDFDYIASSVEGNSFHGRKRDASTSYINWREPTPIAYTLTFKLDLENERLFNSAELVLWKTLVSPVSRVELTEFETVQVILVSHEYYYDTYYKTLMTKESREIIETKFLRTDLSEFVSFDVTRAVQKWLKTGKKSTGLIRFDIVVRPPDKLNSFKKLPPLIKFQIGQKNEANETARLVISLIRQNELTDASSAGAGGAIGQDRASRTKRQATSVRLDEDFCFKNPTEPNCCVRKLEIDFEKDFGWTWIIEPKKYSPNYCTGLCPFFWPTVSDSTRLLQQYKSLNPTSAVEPCCSPDNLKPLVLMFIIGDEPFLQLTQNMIVDNCICR